MEENDSMKFSEWMDTLTISGVSQILLMIVFIIVILWLVIRTFRNKPSA